MVDAVSDGQNYDLEARSVAVTRMSGFSVLFALGDPRAVLHWFDFLCPFCYIGQSRNDLLERHGLNIIHQPFRAHPDIPPGGIEVGSRRGPMYAM